MQLLLQLDNQGHILNEMQVVHNHFECKIPNRAKLPTVCSSCWVPRDIMSNPIYDLHCHEWNKGELQPRILLYEFEHRIKKGAMCMTIISFSQQGYMG
jgi:hypothetical protein